MPSASATIRPAPRRAGAETLGQRSRVFRRERFEHERGRPAGTGLEQLRSGEAQEHDREPGRERSGVLEKVEQRRRGPLDVLDHEHERALGGEPLEQAPEGERDLLGAARRVRGADRAPHGRVEGLLRQLAHDLGQRAVGDVFAVRPAASDQDACAGPRDDLAREPGLADPRRADHRNEAAAVPRGERLGERPLLGGAADERRVGDNGLVGEAVQTVSRANRVGAHPVAHERPRLAAEEDLARGGDAREPRGVADRLADRQRRAVRRPADEHLAGADAHAQRDLARVLQLRGGAERAERVVLVDAGDAERPDDGAIAVTFDGAAVGLEDARAAPPAGEDDGVERLEVERIAEVAQLDADEADEAPLTECPDRGRGGRRWRRLLEVELRRLGEDLGFELPQLLARLEPQLVRQPGSRLAIDGERLRLAPAAVKRQHQQSPRRLAVGMLDGEVAQRAEDLGLAPQLQLRLGVGLDGDGAPLLEGGERRLRERGVAQLRERWAAPQHKGGAQLLGGVGRSTGGERRAAVREQGLETREVVVGVEHVAAELGLEPRFRQRLAQLRDVGLEELRGTGRRRLAPQLRGQPVGGHDPARVQEQDREEPARLGSQGRQRTSVGQDL